jgi:membrane-associated phospholipid phosphatase
LLVSRRVQDKSRTYIVLRTIAAFALAIVCAWGFTWIADEFPERGAMAHRDATLARWLQSHGTERGEGILAAASVLGFQVLYAVLALAMLFFLLRRDWFRLVASILTISGGVLIKLALKATFRRSRPVFASDFSDTTSWSFPSGHAMDSLIVDGLLAYWLAARFPRHRRIIGLATITLVLLIGFSRVYLGMHYLSDVLAGYCAGTVWLLACIGAIRLMRRRQPA